MGIMDTDKFTNTSKLGLESILTFEHASLKNAQISVDNPTAVTLKVSQRTTEPGSNSLKQIQIGLDYGVIFSKTFIDIEPEGIKDAALQVNFMVSYSDTHNRRRDKKTAHVRDHENKYPLAIEALYDSNGTVIQAKAKLSAADENFSKAPTTNTFDITPGKEESFERINHTFRKQWSQVQEDMTCNQKNYTRKDLRTPLMQEILESMKVMRHTAPELMQEFANSDHRLASFWESSAALVKQAITQTLDLLPKQLLALTVGKSDYYSLAMGCDGLGREFVGDLVTQNADQLVQKKLLTRAVQNAKRQTPQVREADTRVK